MLVDIIIVLIIVVSALIGLSRGLIREVLSLGAWVLAFWFAWRFTESQLIYQYLQDYIKQQEILTIASFCILFVAALIALSIIVMLIHKLFDMIGVGGVNKTLGMLFGVARGVLVVAVIIMGAVFINLPSKAWWQESRLVDYFIPLTDYIHTYIPAESQNHIPRQKPVSSQSI